MTSPQPEQVIKEKMGTIEDILEELVLDVVISALLKIADQIQELAKNYQQCNCYRNNCNQRQDMKF